MLKLVHHKQTNSIAWKIKIHIYICGFLYKKGKFWEVGVWDWQSMQDSFIYFAGEQMLSEG